MNKFKFFLFAEVIIAFEAFVLAIIVILLKLPYQEEHVHFDWIVLVVIPILFLMYKSVFELIPFVLISLSKAKKTKIKLQDLKLAKFYSSLIVLFILVYVSFEKPDIFLIPALAYIPSIVLAYLISRKVWIKGLAWSSNM